MPGKRKKINKATTHHPPPKKKPHVLLNDKKDAIKTFLINHFESEEEIDYSKDPIEWLTRKDVNGDTPLFIACQLDDIIAIDIFLVYPDAIKQQDKWSGYRNHFHVACCHSGFIPTLRIMKNEDNTLIHEIDSDGRTPLFFAQPKLFKWLRREAKVDFNIKDNNGQTAFHYNCTQLNVDYCDQLLKVKKIKIETNLLDNNGNNPLFSLIIKMINESKVINEENWDRIISVIRIINNNNREAKYHVLENNENLLHYVCKNYDTHGKIPNCITKSLIKEFESLIHKGNIDGRTPVHLACQFQHDFIKFLLASPYSLYLNVEINKNININKTDNMRRTALYHACEWHNYNAFINIIKFENVNLNLTDVSEYTVLHAIVSNNERYSNNSILMIKYLLKKSPYMIYKFSVDFYTPIRIIYKLINPIQPYKNIGAINEQTQTGIQNKNIGLKIIKILKDSHKESINRPDDKGNTPFHFACKKGPEFVCCREINDLITESTLKMNVRNMTGRTPFHDACFNNNPVIVSRLMKFSSININITDYGGENALHHVIQGSIKNPRYDYCFDTIHILLKTTPFLVNMKNSFSETPLHYVRIMNKDKGGLIVPKINGKYRRIFCQEIDRKFWATLLTTLEHYQKQARLVIFNYFIDNNNIK